MKEKKLIAIGGPTATGKSDLGILLAEQFDGEIISADSVQIYQHLDIGSAKVPHTERRGIKHHLLNVMPAGEDFSVAEYQTRAHRAVADIHQRDKIPFLVGGTGYYIQAVVDDISIPNVPPNHTLRKKLEKESTLDLAELLKERDYDRYQTIDTNNRKRIIRALEIIDTLGSVPKQVSHLPYQTLHIGLDVPDEQLREKIEDRIHTQLQAGLLEEVREIRMRVSDQWLYDIGLEYRYALQYLTGEIQTKEAFIEQLATKTWQYAKRQRTWFQKDTRIQWFSPNEQEMIVQTVEEFL